MEYIQISEEVLDCLKDLTDLAEKILGHIYISKNPEITPIDFFLFFFLQRAANIGKSIALLSQNRLYQDAWAIARIAIELRYYLLQFQLDPSLANRWVSFYILSKYREEYDFHGKDSADKLLAEFAPEIVKKAKDNFGDAFENLHKRPPKWYGFDNLADLVKYLAKKKTIDANDYSMYYRPFSEATHAGPLGIIDAEMYHGAVIGKSFIFLLDMSITVNEKFRFSFENEIADIKRHYINCVRGSTQAE